MNRRQASRCWRLFFILLFFTGIAWFLKRLSRALISFEEVDARDFLLYFGTNFQVVLMKSGDLAQILAQTRPRHARFFLMSSMFFEPHPWHKFGTNATQTA
jgi:flagellar biogenesis protein FliO